MLDALARGFDIDVAHLHAISGEAEVRAHQPPRRRVRRRQEVGRRMRGRVWKFVLRAVHGSLPLYPPAGQLRRGSRTELMAVHGCSPGVETRMPLHGRFLAKPADAVCQLVLQLHDEARIDSRGISRGSFPADSIRLAGKLVQKRLVEVSGGPWWRAGKVRL